MKLFAFLAAVLMALSSAVSAFAPPSSRPKVSTSTSTQLWDIFHLATMGLEFDAIPALVGGALTVYGAIKTSVDEKYFFPEDQDEDDPIIDVSIPYDAAARLAFGELNLPQEQYPRFRKMFEAQQVAEATLKKKQRDLLLAASKAQDVVIKTRNIVRVDEQQAVNTVAMFPDRKRDNNVANNNNNVANTSKTAKKETVAMAADVTLSPDKTLQVQPTVGKLEVEKNGKTEATRNVASVKAQKVKATIVPPTLTNNEGETNGAAERTLIPKEVKKNGTRQPNEIVALKSDQMVEPPTLTKEVVDKNGDAEPTVSQKEITKNGTQKPKVTVALKSDQEQKVQVDLNGVTKRSGKTVTLLPQGVLPSRKRADNVGLSVNG